MSKKLHGKGAHKIVYSKGFLEIYENETHTFISFCGNMGTRLSEVAELFDEKYGMWSFSKLQNLAVEESGTPDYSYSLYVKNENFAKVCLHSSET